MKTESQKLRDSIPLNDEELKAQLKYLGLPSFDNDGKGRLWLSYAALDYIAKNWKAIK